jgi:peptide/nickel transport system substrate-binding protein
MENRFGFKDLIFTVLLVAFIVSVWLAMRQADRHGALLMSIDRQLSAQTQDLVRIRDALRHGVAIGPGTGQAGTRGYETAGPDDDPFYGIRAAQQNEDYAQGDTYIAAFPVIPDRLTPLISADAYSSQIQTYVLESLAQRDLDTLEWRPLIALDWDIQDNMAEWQSYIEQRMQVPLTEEEIRQEVAFPHRDVTSPTAAQRQEQQQYVAQRLEQGRQREQIVMEADLPPAVSIQFRIRRGVHFADGEPLTADDVVFSYDWAMNPAVEAPRARAYLDRIMAVEMVNDHEVVFHFREPYFRAFELAAGMEILPRHFYERFTPSQFNRAPGLLMGSGPYRLPDPEGWRPEPGVPIVLHRNERYWGEPSAFDRMVWRVIEQTAARLTAFRNRELDGFGATPEQYIDLLRDEALLARTHRFEFQSPTAGYRYIGWNQRRGGRETFFADRRVRQAMTMLIDRERVMEDIWYGYGQLVSGPFSPLSPQSNPDIQPWPHDPQRAIQLLREAGFEDRTGDRVLNAPDGRPFRFTLNYPTNSPELQLLAEFIRDAFAAAGIVVDLQPLEWSVLLQRLKEDREFDAVCLGWSGTIEGDPYQIFHSDQITPPGDNSTSYANPDLDRLISQARETVEEEERMPLWHEVHRILHEDQPYTFLATSKSLAFYDHRIRNIRRTAVGLNLPLEWYVPANEQFRTR